MGQVVLERVASQLEKRHSCRRALQMLMLLSAQMHFHRAKQAYCPSGFQRCEDTEHWLMADQQHKNTDPHKKSGAKGSLEISSPILCLQQGNPKARPACSGPCSHNMNISKDRDIPVFLGTCSPAELLSRGRHFFLHV